ncbi:YoaK family protein [Streptomyces sp. NPDC006475]|uniref:YoaK family protein n=1 Tax=unclassified Streptomyces TaxID=2593676 RepID=UPI0033B0B59C
MTDFRERAVLGALSLLSVTTGAVDALSFLVLGHVFTALATGNLLFLAFALGGTSDIPSAVPSTVSLAAFVLGVVCGSALIRVLRRRRPFWLPHTLAAEAVLLAVAAVVALGWPGDGSVSSGQRYAVIGLVALAMGLRNIGVVRAPITGMTTLLIQIPLVTLIGTLLVPGTTASGGREIRFVRPVATVAGMFLGGLAGTLMVPWGPSPALFVLSGVVALIAASGLLLSPGDAETVAGRSV